MPLMPGVRRAHQVAALLDRAQRRLLEVLVRRRGPPVPRVVGDRRQQLAPRQHEPPDEGRVHDLVADGGAHLMCRPTGSMVASRPGEKSETASTSGAAKNSSRLNGTYSPNGTRCILRYTAPCLAVGTDQERRVVVAAAVSCARSGRCRRAASCASRRASWRIDSRPTAVLLEEERRGRLGPDDERGAAFSAASRLRPRYVRKIAFARALSHFWSCGMLPWTRPMRSGAPSRVSVPSASRCGPPRGRGSHRHASAVTTAASRPRPRARHGKRQRAARRRTRAPTDRTRRTGWPAARSAARRPGCSRAGPRETRPGASRVPYSVATQTAGANQTARGPTRAANRPVTTANSAGNSARYATSARATSPATGTVEAAVGPHHPGNPVQRAGEVHRRPP